MNNVDQGVVRRHLNGASFTNEHAQHWNQDGESLCLCCGLPDSLRHRLWHCPESQSLRDSLPSEVRSRVSELPDVCSLHGWTLCSSYRDAWFEYLCSLPDDPVFVWPLELPPILDLFTDGTAWCPTSPRARVAAWSVVLHSPCSAQPSAWTVHPLAAHPLSGLTQTVYRAELRAVVAAVSFAIKASRFCRIWSDCQAVVSGFSKFVLRRCPVNPNHANSDLWRELQVLIWDFGVHKIQLVKVPSHQGSDAELPAFDQWYIAGNSCADRAAKAANQQRGPSSWALWQRFVDDAASLDALGLSCGGRNRRANRWLGWLGCQFWRQFVLRGTFVANGFARLNFRPRKGRFGNCLDSNSLTVRHLGFVQCAPRGAQSIGSVFTNCISTLFRFVMF